MCHPLGAVEHGAGRATDHHPAHTRVTVDADDEQVLASGQLDQTLGRVRRVLIDESRGHAELPRLVTRPLEAVVSMRVAERGDRARAGALLPADRCLREGRAVVGHKRRLAGGLDAWAAAADPADARRERRAGMRDIGGSDMGPACPHAAAATAVQATHSDPVALTVTAQALPRMLGRRCWPIMVDMSAQPVPVSSNPVAVVIAVRHERLRAALWSLLETEPGVEPLAATADVAELARLLRHVAVAVAVVDESVLGDGGIARLPELVAAAPWTAFLVVGMYDQSAYVVRAREAGAVDYVCLDDADRLGRCVVEAAARQVASGVAIAK